MVRKFLIAALLTLGACATQETQTASASGGNDCFLTSDIFTHRAIDDQNIRVTVGPKAYIITVTRNANELNAPEPLIIESTNGRVCTGNGLGLSLFAGDRARPLFVQRIARAPDTPAAG